MPGETTIITRGHALSPRTAAAYSAALRTLPNVAWARSINDCEASVIRIRRVYEGNVEITVDLKTVEDCVKAIHEACEN